MDSDEETILIDKPVIQIESAPAPRAVPAHMPRSLILVMALATGLAVANQFYAQPLLPFIGRDLHLSTTTAGLIITVAQIGYALGLVFLLPLGDLVERRRLIVIMDAAIALALVGVALAPNESWLLPAAAAVGTLSVIAQILIPFAAGLAADDERGKVVGTMMTGLLLGVLLARTVAGSLAELGSWRIIYFVAAGAMLIMSVVLYRMLPNSKENLQLKYGGLLKSVIALARDEPVLRRRALLGGLVFASFNVLWISIAFLLAGPPYHFGPGTIGLFGLAGAAGASGASVIGRLADRGLDRLVTGTSAVLLLFSWLPLWLGRGSLISLLLGIVLLDVAIQGVHINNQNTVFRLQPKARSRINSVYMTTYFIGGAVGSFTSAAAFASYGWTGVSLLGAGFGLAALVLWLLFELASRRRSPLASKASI